MKVIDLDLIKRYVNGDDLQDLDIDVLENDKDFMLNVICFTNDYKMYDLCSDRLKKDYDFVKALLLKFKNNSAFVLKIANYYIENTSFFDTNLRELNILLATVLPDNLSQKYKVQALSFYHLERFEINLSFSLSKDIISKEKLTNVLGMGFDMMYELYYPSDIILNYFAKCLIHEIMVTNEISLERLLHKEFQNPDEITKIGLNNYVLRLLGQYDISLSNYVSTHLDLIKDLVVEIKKIQKNWSVYIKKDERKRYLTMFDLVHEYMSGAQSFISETEMLYYVARKIGVLEKVRYYDRESLGMDASEMDMAGKICYDFVKEQIESQLKEQAVYLNVKKIMLNQLYGDKPLDLDSLLLEKKNPLPKGSKDKIIKLSLHKKGSL